MKRTRTILINYHREVEPASRAASLTVLKGTEHVPTNVQRILNNYCGCLAALSLSAPKMHARPASLYDEVSLPRPDSL